MEEAGSVWNSMEARAGEAAAAQIKNPFFPRGVGWQRVAQTLAPQCSGKMAASGVVIAASRRLEDTLSSY